MSSLKQGNLGDVLHAALQKLHQEEQYDKYLKYLNSEWYYTADDLRLARSDEKVWAEIKLPGRLKIEIANILDEAAAVEANQDDEQLQQQPEEQQFDESAAAEHAPEEYPKWVKCWAAEHECYYYYNMSTEESSWEDPHEGTNTLYDVYQYNEETQQWEVVEDNTSAYYNTYSNTAEADTETNNPFALSENNTPSYTPKGSQKTIFHAESKYSDLADEHEEEAKPSPRTTSTSFTRPKATPRNEPDDRLFVDSPNRPRSLKSSRTPERAEHKRSPNHRTMGANYRNSILPDTPPGVGRNASIQARQKVRARPTQLNTQDLSSESDSDNNVNHSPVHIVRAVKPHQSRHPEHRQTDAAALQKGAISARADDKVRGAREHSPMMSKPVGRPAGARSPQRSPKSPTTRSSTALNSTRSINSVAVSLIDADTKEVPASSAYDWDSKYNDTVDSEHNPVGELGNNNTATGAEEPYDYYKDYGNTEAEYDASQHQAVDRNAEYVVQNQLGAYINAPVGGSYLQQPEETEGTYDEEGNYYANYDQSSKTYYDAAAEYGAEYNAADYDDTAYNSADYNEAEYDPNAEYNDYKDSDYEHPADAYYDHDGADYNVQPTDKHLSRGDYHLTDPATIERVVESSYYNHVSVPSAPPSEPPSAVQTTIPAFSPRSQGAAPYKDSPHTGSARYRDYKSDTPGTPNRDAWSPVATPVRATPAVAGTAIADEYYIMEATAEADSGGDLMALAMGSPATPGDTPQQTPKVKQRSTISKLFRMNLFGGKGPALPSTPPPPRDTAALDPHSSAYRHQLQQERKAAKQSSKSASGKAVDNTVTHRSVNSDDVSSTSGGGSVAYGTNTGSNSTNKATAAHSSYGGHLNDGNIRRKPAPAPADSTNAVNARQKFYAAHAHQNQKHYKYHDRIREIENRNRGSPSSKQEELHYRNLQKLLDMGFGEHESIMALNMCEDNLIEASQMLVDTHNNS